MSSKKKTVVKSENPINGPQAPLVGLVVNHTQDYRFIQRVLTRRKNWTAGHEANLIEAMVWATPKEPRNLWSKIRRDPRYFQALGQYNGVDLRSRWSKLERDYYGKVVPRCYYAEDTLEAAEVEAGTVPEEIKQQLDASALVNQAETSDLNAPLAKAAASAAASYRLKNPPVYVPPSKLGRHSVPSTALHVYQGNEGFTTTLNTQLPLPRTPVSLSAPLLPPLMGPDVGSCDSDDEDELIDVLGLVQECLEDRRTCYAAKMQIPSKLQRIHQERKASKVERKRRGLGFVSREEAEQRRKDRAAAVDEAAKRHKEDTMGDLVKQEDIPENSDDEWSEDSDDEKTMTTSSSSSTGPNSSNRPRWIRPKILRLMNKQEKLAEDTFRAELFADIRYYYSHRNELIHFEDNAEIAEQQLSVQQALNTSAQVAAAQGQPYVQPAAVTAAAVTAVNIVFPLKSLKTYLTCRCAMPMYAVFSVLRQIHQAQTGQLRREILNQNMYSLFVSNPTSRLQYRRDYFGGTRHVSLASLGPSPAAVIASQRG